MRFRFPSVIALMVACARLGGQPAPHSPSAATRQQGQHPAVVIPITQNTLHEWVSCMAQAGPGAAAVAVLGVDMPVTDGKGQAVATLPAGTKLLGRGNRNGTVTLTQMVAPDGTVWTIKRTTLRLESARIPLPTP